MILLPSLYGMVLTAEPTTITKCDITFC